jgi:methylenetetrahydrofolate--tRNA-(uracil-5-)-methyltransferase
MEKLTVIGGGLAGSEAAWQAAERGIKVDLFEMRPTNTTGAHRTNDLAELVCSNSLGSTLPDRASGILLTELQSLHSMLIQCAQETVLPAGHSLAVDRQQFSRIVTQKIESHPRINVIREEKHEFPRSPAIIASGPLTSPSLTNSIKNETGSDHLFFYDAISPSILADSIDHSIVYRGSRYGKGTTPEGDYINCPLNQTEYDHLVFDLVNAKRHQLRKFEVDIDIGVKAGHGSFFEGCLPIEVLAARNPKSLAFGPLRPVGLRDPRTNKRPHAVVQLRQEDQEATTFNMVGFQTNLLISEQKRVFQTIPGLQKAEFTRYGQMHRNTYIASPVLLNPSLMLKDRPGIFFAGQIIGIEGYLGNVASGLLAGINAARLIHSDPLIELPQTTMLGALCHAICNTALEHFQPIKANLGIIQQPLDLDPRANKRQRSGLIAQISSNHLETFIEANELLYG